MTFDMLLWHFVFFILELFALSQLLRHYP